jgi:hypothetical protein
MGIFEFLNSEETLSLPGYLSVLNSPPRFVALADADQTHPQEPHTKKHGESSATVRPSTNKRASVWMLVCSSISEKAARYHNHNQESAKSKLIWERSLYPGTSSLPPSAPHTKSGHYSPGSKRPRIPSLLTVDCTSYPATRLRKKRLRE